MSLLRAFLILPLLALPVLAEDNPLPPRPRPVVTEILTSEAARLRSFPGLIAARVETALAFQTTGRVASRPADRGDRVKAGDVLATLDQITLGEDVAAARAAVAAAQAQADQAAEQSGGHRFTGQCTQHQANQHEDPLHALCSQFGCDKYGGPWTARESIGRHLHPLTETNGRQRTDTQHIYPCLLPATGRKSVHKCADVGIIARPTLSTYRCTES